MDHPHLRTRRSGALLLAGRRRGSWCWRPAPAPSPTAAAPTAVQPAELDHHHHGRPQRPAPAGRLPAARHPLRVPGPVTGKAQPTPAHPGDRGQGHHRGHGHRTGRARWPGPPCASSAGWASASGAITVATDGGGHFAADRRCWAATTRSGPGCSPTLTTFTAGTGFVADGGRLLGQPPAGASTTRYTVQVAATAGAATVGQAFTVEALVTQQTVDPNGVVQRRPGAERSVQLSTDPERDHRRGQPGHHRRRRPGHLDPDLPVAGQLHGHRHHATDRRSGPLPAVPGRRRPPSRRPRCAPAVGRVLHRAGRRALPGRQLHRHQRRPARSPIRSTSHGTWQPGHSVGHDHGPARAGPGVHGQPRPPDCIYTRLS